MSSSRGSTQRKRPQKHQNKTAFKNDLHDTSHQTKFLNSLEVTGVCQRCKDIIDWKIKYKKYKPLSAPKKCVSCEQKTVKYAYHILCTKCGKDKNLCTKCGKAHGAEDATTGGANNNANIENEMQAVLKTLPERKRRTVLRQINKAQESGQPLSKEMLTSILSNMPTVDSLGDEFDDLNFSSDPDISDDDSVEN